ILCLFRLPKLLPAVRLLYLCTARGGWRMSLCEKIFVAAGNSLHPTSQGFQSGHEPTHASKSGACVAIDTNKDLWYCRSCLIGGGPIQALMSLTGCSRGEAL